jgi:hypothetical protein
MFLTQCITGLLLIRQYNLRMSTFILIGLFALSFSACMHTPPPIINSFEDCVAAGNPVMESYPPMCNADGQTFTQDIGNELDMTEVIKISNPRPNQSVSSPLTITGQARGTYYFEATFPVRLETEEGQVLVQHYVEAEGEWMTENFVPFTTTLTFTIPSGVTKGILILEKSNPSGLPENAQALRIPVTF